MIVRVLSSGKDAAGLTRYLFGPGKANEHTNQRMVAGSTELHAEWGDAALTSRQATHLGRLVEMSWRRQYAPELALAGQGAGGISRGNLAGGEGAVPGQQHVFHATLAMRADEDPLTDEQWREVCEKYMRGMGYVDNPDHEDASWFAVHHGQSAEGNDHVHVVMCTTLRDGSNLNVHNSGIQSQAVRREVLERLDFVTPLHDQELDNAPTLKGYTAAEHNKARERAEQGLGSSTPDRVQLQRIVRAAATQATTEAEFINGLLSHPGVQIEPARWAPGDRSVVTGYKVALNDGPVFPASKLASDLTLPKMRQHWTGETPESREVARQLWQGDTTKLDPLRATPDVPAQLAQAAQHLETFNHDLANLDPHDKAAWDHALASLSGTATVLATGRPAGTDPQGRGTGFGPDAGRAADALARQALVDTAQREPQAAPKIPRGLNGAEVATRHVQLALRAGRTDQHRGWLAVVQQIGRAADAMRRAKEARGELQGARAMQRDVTTALSRFETYLAGTVVERVDPTPTTSSAKQPPHERESERLLRERPDDRQVGESTGPMTDAAREALEVVEHARGHSGRPQPDAAPTEPAARQPARPKKPTPKRGRGRE